MKRDKNIEMRFTYTQENWINHIRREHLFKTLNDLNLLDVAPKLFQGSTTLHAKKLLRARTLQSGFTRVYGWLCVILLVRTTKKLSTLRLT